MAGTLPPQTIATQRLGVHSDQVATNIRQWLEGLGLSRYADAFEANDIGPDLLPQITDQILKDIGVASAGHRLRMLASIASIAPSAPGRPPVRAGDAAAPSAERHDGERRQATVLVADISGYTTLCGRLDPEQVQALLGRFYEVTDGIVAGYGGHVIDHAGDGTLALFGAPIAHDNDADRAVRAALDMQAQVAAIIDPCGQALVLHTGIASGEVVAATIATGATPKYAVTGEAVNLAARLCGVASAGQTVIAETTWSRVSSGFDAEPMGERQVKGIDRPVSLWSVRGPRLDVAERRPFFGRQIELRQVIGALDAAEAGRGMALCVRGEAGIGKSRSSKRCANRPVREGLPATPGSCWTSASASGRTRWPRSSRMCSGRARRRKKSRCSRPCSERCLRACCRPIRTGRSSICSI